MTEILDLPATDAQDRTCVQDYTTIRTSIGVYPVTAPMVRVTGDDRLALLDRFFSRSADFVEPDTTRECLTLRPDGSPFALMVHLELGEETWLLPRTGLEEADLREYLAALDVPAGVEVTVAPRGWGATAFEGPLAWQVAARFVEFDISGLTLHAITPVEISGAPDGTTAHLARVGTTGEYGYLLLSDAPETVHAQVTQAVIEAGGSTVGARGLARVQAEAGMPTYHHGLTGVSVNDADLSWMVDWDRIGEFVGSEHLQAPTTASARSAPVVVPAGAVLAAGTVVEAGGVAVGTVLWQTPAANPDEELLFVLVDSPFWVPGLELSARDVDGVERPLRTVSLPRVLSRSSQTRIG